MATSDITKKWMLSSAVAAMTFSLPLAANPKAAPIKPKKIKLKTAQILRFGSEGKSVLLLQQMLANKNLYQNHLDGIYGTDTQTAVMQYQQKNELRVDGIAGPKTLGSLLTVKGNYVPSKRNLSLGDRGQTVRTVQKELKSLGYYSFHVDGIYGPLTKDAVKTFQAANDLQIDGIVGPHTRTALFGQNPKSDASQSGRSSNSNDSNKVYQASAHITNPKKEMPHSSPSASSAQSNKTVKSTASHSDNAAGILSSARNLIGVPYKWGGTSPSGFDCSGFVDYVFRQSHIRLPRTVSSIWNYGIPISHPQPGDLVFFETYKKGPSHVGIYYGKGKFIHADADRGITISSMSLNYWQSRYLGAKRIVQHH